MSIISSINIDMTALTRQPQNTNYLQPTKYVLQFDRIGSVQYFCQTVNIPGMALNQTYQNTPLVDIPIAGNKLMFNPLVMEFAVDENLDSWNYINQWFRALASPISMSDRNQLTAAQNAYKSSGLTSYSDATLTILSALNNPIRRIQYYNVFPVSLTDINLDTKQSADNIITAEATFMYEYFEMLPL